MELVDNIPAIQALPTRERVIDLIRYVVSQLQETPTAIYRHTFRDGIKSRRVMMSIKANQKDGYLPVELMCNRRRQDIYFTWKNDSNVT